MRVERTYKGIDNNNGGKAERGGGAMKNNLKQ